MKIPASYDKQIKETVTLIRKLSDDLERASAGKLSTNDISTDRLLWEVFNKVFTILVTLENSLHTKDSLTIQLIARYSYELMIISAYILLDRTKTENRARDFLTFNQYKDAKRAWTDKTYAQMLEDIPDKNRFASHKKHYRALSNYAHPTMDSFLLNRKGQDIEFLMALSTTLLTIGTIVEVIKICFEQNLYFSDNQKKAIDLITISQTTDRLMKEVGEDIGRLKSRVDNSALQ